MCNTVVYDYRAGIAETFWDCYDDANVEDPCSEEADYVASGCYSFSVENAVLCEETIDECEDVIADCGEVTLYGCELALGQYNSGRRALSVACFDTRLANQAGPNYEGCGTDFIGCAYSPSME